MSTESVPQTSAAMTLPAELELSSADPSVRPLLIAIHDSHGSFELIEEELKKLASVHPSLVREYIVPYSGMPLVFYLGQRLSRVRELTSNVEELFAKCFKTFIEVHGTSPNILDSVMRQNIMFYTAKAGSLVCCRALKALGCVACLQDVHNQTALFYAAREGKWEVVEWLVKEGGCQVNQLDRNGQTALFYAAREDRLECVSKMVNELGADPLVRDIYKKRARAYLKAPTQKRTFDFLTEVERARDPAMNMSHRKLFIVSNEPVGAAAMTLRQHKPYNPYHEEEKEEAPEVVAPPPPKRQKSGASTPSNGPSKPPKERVVRSVSASPSSSPSPSDTAPTPTPSNGRSRFRIKAPLGMGGLESFEKSFPEFALWTSGSPPPQTSQSPSPPKALTRPPRTPVQSITPPWVTVVSLLLRGPMWRYGPATIFHKPVFQLPTSLGPKFQQQATQGEMKLSIDLSVIRKKLEKGKYTRMTEVDKDVRAMFKQAYELAGGPQTDLGLLTHATEVYYDQQLAGCGLAALIREEEEEVAKNVRASILASVDTPKADSV